MERYNTDALRYFLLINGPERRDTDFSWREFINSNNGELLGAYGNLVNRTLVFTKKYLNNEIPKGEVESKIREEIQELYVEVGNFIETGNLKGALEKIFEFIRSINKYFDENTPWITVNSNIGECKNTIYNCIYVIGNLSNLLTPFLPESSEKVKTWLGIHENQWHLIELEKGKKIGEVSILFQRLDKSLIEEERKRLLGD
ncbi:Methionine--tRNA ligase [bioreactor metagenome]|uniref:Methionine--tRNA ligase n=1 Tax=bioreactor metagenome TaxID=1076179 RepID=A0A644Y6J1_9ZZZZ